MPKTGVPRDGVSEKLKFRDSLTAMDSRFRGNDGQTATASVKVTFSLK